MYKTGDIVKAKVVGIQNYGAFCELEDGTAGLVHISEISNGFVRNISDFLSIDETYDFYVIDYDESTNQVKLSYKKLKEESKRETRNITKPLSHNKPLFKDTFKVVDNALSEFKNETINVIYNLNGSHNFPSLNIDELEYVKYALNILEKDTLKIKEDALNIRNNNEKLILVGDNSMYKFIEGYASFLRIPLDKLIYVNNEANLSVIKEVVDYIKENDVSVLFDFNDNYTENEAIIYRLFRKAIEDKGISSKDKIFICYKENDEDVISLLNKEWNSSYINILVDINVLRPSILFALALHNADIFKIIQGYRKSIIDNKEKSLYLEILNKSIEGHIVSTYQYYLRFIEFFNDVKLSLDLDYREDNLIQLPSFKDHLRKLRGKECKYIDNSLNKRVGCNICVKESNEYSLGYLDLLFNLLREDLK